MTKEQEQTEKNEEGVITKVVMTPELAARAASDPDPAGDATHIESEELQDEVAEDKATEEAVETASDSEPQVEQDAGGADTGDTEPEETGLNETLVERAKEHGLSEYMLSDFASDEELERALRVLDTQAEQLAAYVAGMKSAGETEKPDDEQKDESDGESGEESKKDEPFFFDIEELREEGYDDISLRQLEMMNEHTRQTLALQKQLEEQRTAMEAMLQSHTQQQYVEEANAFHDIADELDPELFGVSAKRVGDEVVPVDLPPKYGENREKLLKAMHALQNTFGEIGIDNNLSMKELAEKAYVVAFSKTPAQKPAETKKPSRASALKRQSSMRRSASQASSAAPLDKLPNKELTTQEIVNHPSVRKILEDFNL